jgi:hypothetical protein
MTSAGFSPRPSTPTPVHHQRGQPQRQHQETCQHQHIPQQRAVLPPLIVRGRPGCPGRRTRRTDDLGPRQRCRTNRQPSPPPRRRRLIERLDLCTSQQERKRFGIAGRLPPVLRTGDRQHPLLLDEPLPLVRRHLRRPASPFPSGSDLRGCPRSSPPSPASVRLGHYGRDGSDRSSPHHRSPWHVLEPSSPSRTTEEATDGGRP